MNTSGIEPLDLRVLVLPDPVEDKSKGGIILPDATKDQQKFATVKGTLIAAGVNAWSEARTHPDFRQPEPGDRVMVAKYGGINVTGSDAREYRVMNDADVIALLQGDA